MPQPIPSSPSPCDESTRKDTRDYLERFGFRRVKRPHRELYLFLALSALFTLVSIQFHNQFMKVDLEVGEVIVALVAFGALLLGYQQWNEQRHETSMDHFYERLDIANRIRSSAGDSIYPLVRYSLPEADLQVEYKKWLYLYAELDNLEYVIEKYRWGFMKVEQACRGLRTFQRRCNSDEFRRMALSRVGRGDYNEATTEVVKRVVLEIEPGLSNSPEGQTRAA